MALFWPFLYPYPLLLFGDIVLYPPSPRIIWNYPLSYFNQLYNFTCLRLCLFMCATVSIVLCCLSRGRIFSQFENELVPSWERGIREKHWELILNWEQARSQFISSLTKNTASGVNFYNIICAAFLFYICTDFVLVLYFFGVRKFS